MNKKVALITGITGQDGSYLAEFLLKKNYIVHGIKENLHHLIQRVLIIFMKIKNIKKFFSHYGDLLDANLVKIINKIRPDELYNFAAQSHVCVSFILPNYTTQVNSIGTLNLLQAILDTGNAQKKIQIYQASPQNYLERFKRKKQSEKTKFYLKSPYATSKLFAYWITKNYRESYNIFSSNGILFMSHPDVGKLL